MSSAMGAVYFIAIALAMFAWIVLLVDVVRRSLDPGVRVVLFLVVFFLPVFGSLLYYVLVVRADVGAVGASPPRRVLVEQRVLLAGVGLAVVLGGLSGFLLLPGGNGVVCVEGSWPGSATPSPSERRC